MRKAASILLVFTLLFTWLCSSAAFGEEIQLSPQEEEFDKVLTWLLADIPEEERDQALTWDRDTILEKLEGYDQPLEYTTKEEIADGLAMMTGLLGLMQNAAESDEGGANLMKLFGGFMEGQPQESQDSGFMDLLGGLMGGQPQEGEGGSFMDLLGGLMGGQPQEGEGGGFMDLLGGLMGGQPQEGEGGGFMDLLGGLMGGQPQEGEGGSFMDLLGGLMGGQPQEGEGGGFMDLLGGLMGGQPQEGEGGSFMDMAGGLLGGLGSLFGVTEPETSGETYFSGILTAFDGTFWKSGDMNMEIAFQDGYYKVAIQEGDTELSYLCEYDEIVVEDKLVFTLTGIGTGDEEMNETQPDHGIAVFLYDSFANEVTWQRDGEEIVFTQIIDPLDGSKWVGNNKSLTMRWRGGLNYEVAIEQPATMISWSYQCTLNEETNTLEGTGSKTEFSQTLYEDAKASFALNEKRTKLTWTDEKEPDAAEGLALDAVPCHIVGRYWESDRYGLNIFEPDGFGLYSIYVFEADPEEITDGEPEETDLTERERVEYQYLCTFDWETNTFTSADPSTIDFESLTIYVEQEKCVSTATFTLTDESHLVWMDDSGLSGDGVTLEGILL